MEIEKIRNLNDGELERQERQTAEQLFRLRFQMKLGQNEGVKKLRELRKDIARIEDRCPRACAGFAGSTVRSLKAAKPSQTHFQARRRARRRRNPARGFTLSNELTLQRIRRSNRRSRGAMRKRAT